MQNVIKFSFVTLFLFIIATQTSNADVVLTFDQSGVGNGSAIDQNYGDRIVSATDGSGHSYDIIPGTGLGLTPNLEVNYVGAVPALWTTNYGDLTNVLYEEIDAADGFEITFEADAGFEVGLFAFDMAAFGSGETIPGINILDGDNNVLWSSGSAAIPATGRNSFNTGGLFAESLTIAIDLTGLGNNSDNIGIDNIQFGQRIAAIPEPTGAGILLTCFLTYSVRRRRSNS